MGYEELLRRARIRPTRTRLAIFGILESVTPERMGVDDIYLRLARGPEPASKASIYRLLNELHRAGLLHKLFHADGKVQYWSRTADEINLKEGRFVCANCSRSVSFDDEELRERLAIYAERKGLPLVGQSLLIQGLCLNCRPQ